MQASRAFDSQVCDEIQAKQVIIDKQLKSDQQIKQNLLSDIQNLKKDNKRLSDDVIESQARSMRHNLLFFNFEEKNTIDERKSEYCTETIFNLYENDIGMTGARDQIKMDQSY